MQHNQPSQEAFDAMNDAEFEAWWAHAVEAAHQDSPADEVRNEDGSVPSVEAVFDAWHAAQNARFG